MTAVPKAHTHVRLGASHGGDPPLLGQHRGDVEVCDVHMPWRERRTTESVTSIQSSGITTLPTGSIWSFVCKFLHAFGLLAVKAVILS